MIFNTRKIATILVVAVCLQALCMIFVQDSLAASKKVKQQIAATPPVTKAEKNNAAQLQAIEAQLRYWQGQEKAKPKPAEAAKLGLTIGQNVKSLWLQKYTLEEAMKPKEAAFEEVKKPQQNSGEEVKKPKPISAPAQTKE